MAADLRVPIIEFVDFGVHEFGRILATPLGAVSAAGAGSIFQILVPLAFAAYFFVRDEGGAAACLGWAATNCADVARYMTDPHQQLPLLGGGQHDWPLVFAQLHLTAHTQQIADLTRLMGWLLLVGACVLLARAYVLVKRPTPA